MNEPETQLQEQGGLWEAEQGALGIGHVSLRCLSPPYSLPITQRDSGERSGQRLQHGCGWSQLGLNPRTYRQGGQGSSSYKEATGSKGAPATEAEGKQTSKVSRESFQKLPEWVGLRNFTKMPGSKQEAGPPVSFPSPAQGKE